MLNPTFCKNDEERKGFNVSRHFVWCWNIFEDTAESGPNVCEKTKIIVTSALFFREDKQLLYVCFGRVLQSFRILIRTFSGPLVWTGTVTPSPAKNREVRDQFEWVEFNLLTPEYKIITIICKVLQIDEIEIDGSEYWKNPKLLRNYDIIGHVKNSYSLTRSK